MSAAEDKSALKDAEAVLEAEKDRLVAEHLASAASRAVLAPLEREVDVLKDKLGLLKKDEEK